MEKKKNNITDTLNKIYPNLPDIKTLADYERRDIEWVIKGILSVGKLTIIAGDPGVSKSLLALFLGAMITTQNKFIDDSPIKNGHVILCSTEDDPNDTIRPRLEDIGGDLSKTIFMRNRKLPNGKSAPLFLSDIPYFELVIEQIRSNGGNISLIIFDSLESFLCKTNSYKSTEIRSILEPFIDFAARNHITVLGIMHLNKSNKKAPYRINGSIAFTALARMVYIICKDNKIDNRRVMLPVKNNISIDTIGYEYFIETNDGNNPEITNFKYCYEKIEDYINDESKDNDRGRISPEQFKIITLFYKNQNISLQLKDIAKTLELNTQSTVNMLNKLIEKGIIRRADKSGFYCLREENSSLSSNSSVSSYTSDITEIKEKKE